jgi:hypothetical protein
MQTMKAILRLTTPALLAVALLAACSKQEEPQAPAEMPATKRVEPAPAAPASVAPAPVKPAPSAPSAFRAPPATGNPAQDVAALETGYISSPDFNARVETIYKLTDLGTAQAISSLGRLFHMEKDPDLRTEMLDALFDIDGQDENKAALLAAGAGPDQPKEVRLSAIDALEDVDAKLALPILRSLASDPDPEISDTAKSAIEMLQEDTDLQKK